MLKLKHKLKQSQKEKSIMKNTTLCYIENDGKYLLLYRSKIKNDGNDGKYIGIGGHFEENESPYDCIIREVKEETGLDITPKYRGIVTFVSDKYETEQMHLFTATEFTGEECLCNEGTLEWVEKSKLSALPMWEGDYVFLDLLEKREDFFSLKLKYIGNNLTDIYIDNKKCK